MREGGSVTPLICSDLEVVVVISPLMWSDDTFLLFHKKTSRSGKELTFRLYTETQTQPETTEEGCPVVKEEEDLGAGL